jgi:hypothetical protein
MDTLGHKGRRRGLAHRGAATGDEYDEADRSMDHERSSERCRRLLRATADIRAVIADNQPTPEPAARSLLITGADTDSWQPLEGEE